MTLRGRRVVITGASSGIGRAAAIEFARRGATVVLAARRVAQLESVAHACRAEGGTAEVVVTDVSRQEECARLIAQAGTVDVLVNNAGFGVFADVVEASADDLASMVQTNALGTIWCTQAVLPQMLSRRSGAIVNVGSIAGIMGYAHMAGYCASKFAVSGFTEALRDELSGSGVSVALVCPATTETDFFTRAERKRMPGAARLIAGVSAERVARAVCEAAEDGRYRRIVPYSAAVYMRFKEFFPRLAHLLMRRVSALLE